jgi:hypothetical protein
MPNIPLSDVTLITAALGLFFLIVAFYKSIFHKRKPKAHAALAEAAAPREHLPVKLADPFQQVSVDSIPPKSAQAPADAPFYPAYPSPNGFKTVSAFRQFNPNKEFAAAAQKPEADYEWE